MLFQKHTQVSSIIGRLLELSMEANLCTFSYCSYFPCAATIQGLQFGTYLSILDRVNSSDQ